MHGIQKSCIIVLGKSISEAGLSKEAKYFLLIWERMSEVKRTKYVLLSSYSPILIIFPLQYLPALLYQQALQQYQTSRFLLLVLIPILIQTENLQPFQEQ